MYNYDTVDILDVNKIRFMIGLELDQWVLTQSSERSSYLRSSTNKDLVTVMETVSGGGRLLSPTVILSGNIYQEHEYIKTGLDNDYIIAVLKSCYSNDHVVVCRLSHF
jgi:hypothetical protein